MLRASPCAVLLLAGCGGGSPPAGPPPLGVEPCRELRVERIPTGASVVVVINDTMRRDRAGAYGGSAATPSFDAFAAEGLLFTAATAPAPWTKASIASLFTSLYPSQHQVASDPRLGGRPGTKLAGTLSVDVLAKDFATLAEILQQAGLRTAAFVANPFLEARHGFAQGFETYEDGFGGWKQADGEAVSRAALDWLEGLPQGQPFLLYVHYIDSHRPYGRLTPEEAAGLPPAPPEDAALLGEGGAKLVHRVLRRTDGQPLLPEGRPPSRAAVERAYDRGIEDFDRALGVLLAGLRDHESWERTAVIVTSDHGEALFERGYGNHGLGLYDDELAIPFAARFPGARPASGRIDCPISLVDVLPSLCEYLGLRPPPFAVGWSIVAGPSPEPAPARRFVVSEGTMVHPRNRAIRDRRYKLVHQPERDAMGPTERPWQLFDLASDPAERRDLLAADPPPALEEVLRRMQAALPGAVPPYTPPEKTYVPLDDQQVEQLRALGYVED